MILDKLVEIKISNQGNHFRNLGYTNVKQGTKLIVPIEHPQEKSCIKISCKCDDCGEIFKRLYQQLYGISFHRCYSCSRMFIGKTMNKENIIKATKTRIKENHPRFNPNKPKFQEYTYKVRLITEKTYKENEKIINPLNYTRSLCGIEGGYQLDHIISVKFGFDNNIPPEIIGGLENLQMLSWEENRNKWHK